MKKWTLKHGGYLDQTHWFFRFSLFKTGPSSGLLFQVTS